MDEILVVEDSPTGLAITAHVLAGEGYQVLTAVDGEEAMRLAEERQPAAILLDVILPKVNGYQVCRQLKAKPETSHIPIVLITSKSKDSDRQWGIEQGADAFITKPFNSVELLRIIDQVLSCN